MPEIKEDNSVECCSIWIARELSQQERGWFYIRNTLDILAKRRKYALAGAKNPRIANRFRILYPHYLYKGPAKWWSR